MKAAELMTSPVVTVTPATDLTNAAELLFQHSVNTLPVVDADGQLVGIVTETDIFRALALKVGIGVSPTARLTVDDIPRRIADIAHKVEAWVKPEDNVSLCLAHMARNNGRSIPVLDHGRVVGIISRREALSALSTQGAIDSEVIRDRARQGQLPVAADTTPVST